MDLINNNTVFVATLWRGHEFGYSPKEVELFYLGTLENIVQFLAWRLIGGELYDPHAIYQ